MSWLCNGLAGMQKVSIVHLWSIILHENDTFFDLVFWGSHHSVIVGETELQGRPLNSVRVGIQNYKVDH